MNLSPDLTTGWWLSETSVYALGSTFSRSLPIITNANGTSFEGMIYGVEQCSTGTVTINTQSSQNLGDSASGTTTCATSVKGQIYWFIATIDNSGHLFWAVLAMNGATAIP